MKVEYNKRLNRQGDKALLKDERVEQALKAWSSLSCLRSSSNSKGAHESAPFFLPVVGDLGGVRMRHGGGIACSQDNSADIGAGAAIHRARGQGHGPKLLVGEPVCA